MIRAPQTDPLADIHAMLTAEEVRANPIRLNDARARARELAKDCDTMIAQQAARREALLRIAGDATNKPAPAPTIAQPVHWISFAGDPTKPNAIVEPWADPVRAIPWFMSELEFLFETVQPTPERKLRIGIHNPVGWLGYDPKTMMPAQWFAANETYPVKVWSGMEDWKQLDLINNLVRWIDARRDRVEVYIYGGPLRMAKEAAEYTPWLRMGCTGVWFDTISPVTIGEQVQMLKNGLENLYQRLTLIGMEPVPFASITGSPQSGNVQHTGIDGSLADVMAKDPRLAALTFGGFHTLFLKHGPIDLPEVCRSRVHHWQEHWDHLLSRDETEAMLEAGYTVGGSSYLMRAPFSRLAIERRAGGDVAMTRWAGGADDEAAVPAPISRPLQPRPQGPVSSTTARMIYCGAESEASPAT